MRKRFKTALTIIFMLFIICVAIGVGYLFYNEVITIDSDIVVDGDLTINYLDGKSFTFTEDATITFSVTNNSSDRLYYYIQLTDVSADGVSYTLTSDNIDITSDLKSDIISNQVTIDGGSTTSYKLTFITSSDSEYSGTIQIGLKSNEESLFSDVILSDNSVSDTVLTSIGESSLVDEGLISAQDDSGVAYYFRGSVTNNNVSFAGFDWKIVKINGDGSVKLVLDGIIDDNSKYDDTLMEYTDSSISEVLDTWYEDNLSSYSSYIAYNKYCNDNVLESDVSTYASYSRIITNKIPTFVCLGNTVNARIGLLTADEVMLAGASTSANTSYYLYNSSITISYYTMTSAVYSGGVYYPFAVNSDGSLGTSIASTLIRGVRPVINIIKNAQVTGDGTEDNPYKIVME